MRKANIKTVFLCFLLVSLSLALHFYGKMTLSSARVSQDGYPHLGRQIKLKRVKLLVFDRLVHLEKRQLRELRQLREMAIADAQVEEFRLDSAVEVVQALEINLALAEEALREGNVAFAEQMVKAADADLAFLEKCVTGKSKWLF